MNYIERQWEIINSLRISRGGDSQRSTIPIQPSHSETARTLTSVAFPSSELASEIEAAVVAPLRAAGNGHHYYPKDAMHLTVKNVRVIADPPNFDESTVKTAIRVFEDVVRQHEVITFRLSRLIAMETSVALFGTANESFRDLVLDLDKGLREAGVPDDKRYLSSGVFFGSVTLCRFASAPSQRFLNLIESLEQKNELRFEVNRITLTSFDGLTRAESLTHFGNFDLQPSGQGIALPRGG